MTGNSPLTAVSHPVRRQMVLQPAWFFLFFLLAGQCQQACCFFGWGRKSTGNQQRFNYTSVLDDIVRGYTNSQDGLPDEWYQEIQSGNSSGFLDRLWSMGKKKGMSAVEGVRTTRGGALAFPDEGSTTFNSIDLMAQALSLRLAWLVAAQATVTALVTHRESVFGLAARLVKSDTIAAVKTIHDIFESVDDHGVIDIFHKYPARELVAAIYALSRIQAATGYYHTQDDADSSLMRCIDEYPEVEDKDLLKELTRYAPYASAAYGWKLDLATAWKFHRNDLHALVRMCKIDEEDVVKVEWESRANRPAFFIVRDLKGKRIVMSIRGTWSAHDVLTDLCCTPEEYSVPSLFSRKHSAHNGMLAAARGVKELAEEIIAKELDDHPDFSLTIVGHSLGGSVAAILGTMWGNTFRDCKVFAYGPACVAPMNDMDDRRIVSILLEGDPFSSLSLGHVADVSQALAYLCDEEDVRRTILTVTDGPLGSLDKDDLKWCKDQMKEIRSRMTSEKLYPPGRLLFLSVPDDRKGTAHVREVPPSVYGELKICARMFDLSRHVPRVYHRRLKNVLRGNRAAGT